MKRALAAFACGLLFAAGLLVSGMTRPTKVIGFLDFAGRWDTSLAFVMVGGIGVHFILRRVIVRRSKALLGSSFECASAGAIDRKLVVGAGLFGVGWGLAGYCPGPGIVSSLASGSGLAFALAMCAGMLLHARHAAGISRSGGRPSPDG